MPVIVTLKGTFEPLILDEDLAETFNSLNLAGATGRKFVVSQELDGEAVLMALDQVLTIKEIGRDDPRCLLV